MHPQFIKWSWSMLQVYRTCRFWAYLKYIERSPEPPREKDDRRDRGTIRHKMAEDFILADDAPFPQELIKFEGLLTDVRDIRRGGLGEVTLEKPHYYDHNWRPCEEEDRWLVVIPDIHVKVPGQVNLTIDEKTGKRYGNELKHYGQTELYAITAKIDDPSFETYEAELWYLDLPGTWQITFEPAKLDKAQAKLDAEVNCMMEDKLHRPNPSKATCKYCPYAPHGTGACPVGVSR